MSTATTNAPAPAKPIYLYDHLPGILAGYPAILFLILALLSLPHDLNMGERWWSPLSQDAIFWIGLGLVILWYIAHTFNLPKEQFWLVFGLLGTFVGIPVILELTGYIKPFAWLAAMLGALAPQANAGAWFVGALVFGVIWLGNFIWSRTHLSVRLDDKGLTIRRVGGRGEHFDLAGLKSEHEPLDYLETFLAGVGSLSLKTRMNKPVFTMKRVIGLYRPPMFPFFRGKLARVEELLSSQTGQLYIPTERRAELSDAEDADRSGTNPDVARELDTVPAEQGKGNTADAEMD